LHRSWQVDERTQISAYHSIVGLPICRFLLEAYKKVACVINLTRCGVARAYVERFIIG
jgi:hypothetical protein